LERDSHQLAPLKPNEDVNWLHGARFPSWVPSRSRNSLF